MSTKASDFKQSPVLTGRKIESEMRTQSYSRTMSASKMSLLSAFNTPMGKSRLQSATQVPLEGSLCPAESHAEKAEVIELGRLKGRIQFMQNRLKVIAVAKQRNKGKVDTFKKKAENILSVRNVAEEMNRNLADHRDRVTEVTKELQEQVEWTREEQKKMLDAARKEARLEKSATTNKTKEIKKVAKETRKLKEAETLVKNKELISLLNLQGSLAEARGEKRMFKDGVQLSRSVTSKHDGLLGSRMNGFMERFEEYGMDDMRQELERLLEEESVKANELEKTIRLEKQAKEDLLAVAKSQIL